MPEQLLDHYEAKYAHEAHAGEIAIHRPSAYPTNRYAVCVSAMHRLFKGGAILELGAGSGTIAKSLIESHLPFEHYTLTDLARPRVEGVRRALSDQRLSAEQMNAEAIPAQFHGRYDAVLMVALIEHLIDPLRAMQSIRKLLRPGGFVYVDTPNIAKYTRRIKLALGQFPSTASLGEGLVTYEGKPVDLYDEGHLHYFTYRSLRLMLQERCGFSHVRACGYFHAPNRRAGFMSTLARKLPELFSDVAVVAYG